MGVTHGLEICHGQCWVLSYKKHFERGLETVFAKGMEVVQKWTSKDYKESEKGKVGKLAWAEDEEGNQEVAQRKPTPGRGRMSQEHLPTPMVSWFPVVSCKPNCTQPSQL